METTPGKDAVEIIEMTTEHLEYYTNLVTKQQQRLRALAPVLQDVLPCVKCCQTTPHAQGNSPRKEESLNAANFIVFLVEEIATATPTFSNHHPDQSAAANIKAGPSPRAK